MPKSSRTRRPSSAHPRSRGEHFSDEFERMRQKGSSPLARGTLQSFAHVRNLAGLIPAHAGNTGRLQKAVASRWAHPRSRGEHFAAFTATTQPPGSSPLARGTRLDDIVIFECGGLIPARAGNTPSRGGEYPTSWAHPRSRREHSKVPMVSPTLLGSSPLARGTRVIPESIGLVVGLIPARAGNTESLSSFSTRWGAHPRSRGEHGWYALRYRALRGSSPLARGTQTRATLSKARAGLIPARAGNTHPGGRSKKSTRAHPRSRGEHSISETFLSRPRGSSPLARGTPGH